MACCLLTALVMNRLIKACDFLDIRFLQIRYNDDEGGSCAPAETEKTTYATCRISISGMTCGACTSSVTNHLKSLKGVLRANVSLALGRANVSYDTILTTPEQMLQAIRDGGYDAALGDKSVQETIQRLRRSHELHNLRATIASATFCSMIGISIEYTPSLMFICELPSTFLRILPWFSLSIAFRVQIWDAWPIHSRAWIGRGRRTTTMDTLLSLSLLLGLSLAILQMIVQTAPGTHSYTSSGILLTVVILAGKYLEAVLQRESNSNLAALYELQTEKETYRLTESEVTVSASLLQKGDDIFIRQGATVPCDCFVVHGRSAFNESTITGEALPVIKSVGDFLLAGTKNISRQVRVVVSQDQSKSSLARVIEGVTAATEQRQQGAEHLDILMNYFVSGVMCLAVLTFGLTISRNRALPFLECFVAACERATAVLAAACPCGIGLATPSAAMAGIDVAYSQGALLGGGINTMQALQQATHIVMDKTGTLTEGQLNVVDCRFDKGLRLSRSLCYRLLAAAEMEDARVHPVAKTVFKWALANASKDMPLPSSEVIADTRNVVRALGKGISCEVRGHSDAWMTVHVGHMGFLEENAIEVPILREPADAEASTVFFAFDRRYAGRLCVQDTIRREASTVVASLVDDGLQITMLTGDTATEASRISSMLQIPVLASRALPTDKMRHIKHLQSQGHRVVMVGDGINDSLAQATADVGISISLTQGCFSDASSVVIVSGSLHSLSSLFAISRRVVAQAKVNSRWALVYNLLAISLAMGVGEKWGLVITASMAGSLMALSSCSILGMSLWLRWSLRRNCRIVRQ